MIKLAAALKEVKITDYSKEEMVKMVKNICEIQNFKFFTDDETLEKFVDDLIKYSHEGKLEAPDGLIVEKLNSEETKFVEYCIKNNLTEVTNYKQLTTSAVQQGAICAASSKSKEVLDYLYRMFHTAFPHWRWQQLYEHYAKIN